MKAYEITETSGYKTIAFAKNRYWLFKHNKTERYKKIKSARCLTRKPYKYFLCEFTFQDDHKGLSYPSQKEIYARTETEAKYHLWNYRVWWEHFFDVKVSLARHYVVFNSYDIGIRKIIGYFVVAKNKKQVLEKYPNATKIIKIPNKPSQRKKYEICYRWLGSNELIYLYRTAWCEADAYDQYTVDNIDKYKDKKGISVEYIREVNEQ